MKYQLTAHEIRVLGCLLEKQITTPEQYPLSLNALTLACNQKTNREPVMELSEAEVQQTLDLLVRKHFIRTLSGFGNRVVKYEHRFCNSEFGQLKFADDEVALVTTLLLRGAQTPGELRTRSQRLHDFGDVSQVEHCLLQLSQREDGPFVQQLPREPGKREVRYQHLFHAENPQPTVSETVTPFSTEQPDSVAALSAQVAQLENRVAQLEQQLSQLLALQIQPE